MSACCPGRLAHHKCRLVIDARLQGIHLGKLSQVLGALLAALPLRVDMEEAECVCSTLCHLLLNAPRMEAAIELIQPLVEVRPFRSLLFMFIIQQRENPLFEMIDSMPHVCRVAISMWLYAIFSHPECIKYGWKVRGEDAISPGWAQLSVGSASSNTMTRRVNCNG